MLCNEHRKLSGATVFLKGNFTAATFITNYLPLALFPILYVVARLYLKCRPVGYSEMDFIGGLKEIEEEACQEAPPRNAFERFWNRLVT